MGLPTASLPPDDLVRDLLEIYTLRIAPWTLITSPLIALTASPPWSLLVHAIVVVTLRLSRDERVSSPAARQAYHDAARQHVIMHAMEDTSVDSLQALALLAIDSLGAGHGPRKWGVLAALTRSVAHIDLCTETDTLGGTSTLRPIARTSVVPPISSWHDDEERRRLFWLVFILDRYTSISTGWDYAIPDSDVKRRLPCSDARWSDNVGAAKARYCLG